MVCQPPRNLIQPRMGGCMNRRLAWPGSWGDWDGDILPKYPPGSHGMVVMVMLHQISDFLLFMLPTPGSRGVQNGSRTGLEVEVSPLFMGRTAAFAHPSC